MITLDIFQMSYSAGILILIIVVIRALAINKLPKRVFLALWGIVLLRLLIPIAIPMKYSVATVVENIKQERSVNVTDIAPSFPALQKLNVTNMEVEVSRASNTNISVIHVVWMIGAILFLSFFIVAYIKDYRKMQEALPFTRDELLKQWLNKWLLEQKLKRDIKLLESDRISTPLTYGIISPRIVLPKRMDTKDCERMLYVMTHELVHIKRFDNLWKIISVIALCIHWFNPLVWVMYVLFNRDLEISCDEKVISLLGENEKQAYALALIGLAEQKMGIPLLYNGFGKNAIKERIVSIMKYKKTTAIGMGCAIFLVIASTTVFATSKLEDNNTIIGSTNGVQEQSTVPEQNTVPEVGALQEQNTVQEQNTLPEVEYATTIIEEEPFENLKIYEPFGLKYNEEKDVLMYEGQVVRELYDEVTGMLSTQSLGLDYPENSIDLRAVYENNKLVGLRLATDKEYEERNKAREASSKKASGIYGTEQFDQYFLLGLEYNLTNENLYYNGELVRYFLDSYKLDSYSEVVIYEYVNEDGTIDIHTERGKTENGDGSFDPGGALLKIVPYSQEEFDKRDFEEMKNPTTSVAEFEGESGAGGRTLEEHFLDYKNFGLDYNKETTRLHYNGKLVRSFLDSNNGDIFMYSKENGEVDVYAVYDEDGTLIGLEVK